MPDVTAAEPDPRPDIAEIPEETLLAALAEAQHLLRQGDSDGAVRITLETLQKGGIGMTHLVDFQKILAAAGRDDIANDMRAQLLDVLDRVIDDSARGQAGLNHIAMLCLELDDPGRAVRAGRMAVEQKPEAFNALMIYTMALLKNGSFDMSLIDPIPALKTVQNPVALLSGLASMMGNFGDPASGLEMLKICEPYCTNPGDKGRIDTLRAGLLDEDPEIDQRAMATGIFDNFAEAYDQKLNSLGNNGPQMIARGLAELGLAQDGSRDILDAGCGTGLCAPCLRPYARHLHGVDLSIPMLEKCRDKGTFDLLARTDLAVRDTFPKGDFDLVVSGDVLVYFGALDTVFANLSDVLRPGGRVIFTVEEAPTPGPARGYAYTPSGRNQHTEAYVRGVLERSGFLPPDLVLRDVLRFEFGNPIHGMAISATRPA